MDKWKEGSNRRVKWVCRIVETIWLTSLYNVTADIKKEKGRGKERGRERGPDILNLSESKERKEERKPYLR